MSESEFPQAPDYDTYWPTVHAQPLSVWMRGLESIRQRHGLAAGEWRRFNAGRNVVFALDMRVVVKLVPEFWFSGATREAAALEAVHGRLPIASPELIGRGELGEWSYLVMSYVPGRCLRPIWRNASTDERMRLATQHGRLAKAVHEVQLAKAARSALQFDWDEMLNEQRDECRNALERSKLLPGHLLNDLNAFLDTQWPLHDPPDERVFLQGDIDPINLLVDDDGNLSGMVDFSDAKIGSPEHELLSPMVHSYRGDAAAIAAFHAAWEWKPGRSNVEVQDQLMARVVLYYAHVFERVLACLAEGEQPASWRQLGSRLLCLANHTSS